MKMTVIGRNGALTKYQIEDYTDSVVEKIKTIVHYSISENDGIITGATNRAEIARLRALEVVENAPVNPETTKQSRYIDLLVNAEMQKKSHGAAWICNGYHVDKNSLNPAWEGHEICYVYNK